jgi:uncharacterized protein YciW
MTDSSDWFPDRPKARIVPVEHALDVLALQRVVTRLRAALKPFAALASEPFVMRCYDENAKLFLKSDRKDLAGQQTEVFARDALAALYAFNETNPKPGKSEWQ